MLFEYPTLETALREALVPWLAREGRVAWRSSDPVAIVLPGPAWVRQVKDWLAREKIPVVGVKFWTLRDLRDGMATEREAMPFERETLELALAAAAESLATPLAKTVSMQPAPVMRLLERWVRAGHSLAAIEPPSLAEVATRWQTLLSTAGLASPAARELHWLRSALDSPEKIQGRYYLVGFGAENWEHWALLAGLALRAESFDLAIPRVGMDCAESERLWLGNWEALLNAASQPLAGHEIDPARKVRFFAAQNHSHLAAALWTALNTSMGEHEKLRVGVVDGSGGVFAGHLGAVLRDAGVPHWDGFGRLAAGERESADWQAWLAWENDRTLEAFVSLMKELPGVFGEARNSTRLIENAMTESGLEDFAWLTIWLVSRDDLMQTAFGNKMRDFPMLPERATLSEMHAATSRIFEVCGWKPRHDMLKRVAHANFCETTVSRVTFLRWLTDSLASWAFTTPEIGQAMFANIALLPPGGAELAEWDILILAGLAEGEWPQPIVETLFLGDATLAAWNAKSLAARRATKREGPQGSGHEILQPGFAWMPTASELRRIEQKRVEDLPGAASLWYAVTLSEEKEPETPLEPSHYFLEAWQRAKSIGQAPEHLEDIRAGTIALIPAVQTRPHAAVHAAWCLRRDVMQAFGEYDCGMSRPPAAFPSLAGSRWEAAVEYPQSIWFEKMLGLDSGLESSLREGLLGHRLLGTWNHRFAATAFRSSDAAKFAPIPDRHEAFSRMEDSIQRLTHEMQQVVQQLQLDRPPAEWRAFLQEVSVQAKTLVAAAHATISEGFYHHVAVEWNLPDESTFLIGDTPFPMRGRLDLVAAEALKDGHPSGAVLVVDYKSKMDFAPGTQLPLGIQLLLYRESLNALPEATTTAGLVLRTGIFKALESTLANRPVEQILQGLAKIRTDGVLGVAGKIDPRRKFSISAPVAMVPIAASIAEARWALTHPLLTRSKKPIKGSLEEESR